MSYHRGEPYVWDDGTEIHLWSNLRDSGGYNSCVRIEGRIFDEIVCKRLAHMAEEGRVPLAIQGAIRKMGKGQWLSEMLKASRKKAKP